MTTDKITLKIADITFCISGSSIGLQSLRSARYHDFICSDPDPDVSITLRDSFRDISELSLPDTDCVFDTGTVWRLYESPHSVSLVLTSPVGGPLPYRVAVFDRDISTGEIASIAGSGAETEDRSQYDPLEFPLSEVLMVYLLSMGKGLMTHACGISDSGRGLLFPGNSTDGKSTIALQWRSSASVLNDDRIILRESEKGFLMYGTPWHGDLSDVSAEGVVLESVDFLRHGSDNISRRVSGAEAVSMLLRRSFLPLWSTSGMEFSLDLCRKLEKSVPFHELHFVPDERIVDYIRCRN
ncbi:MAG: hypothetical protein ABFR50_06320 [Candidatus Fermentibacteria bacterium]